MASYFREVNKSQRGTRISHKSRFVIQIEALRKAWSLEHRETEKFSADVLSKPGVLWLHPTALITNSHMHTYTCTHTHTHTHTRVNKRTPWGENIIVLTEPGRERFMKQGRRCGSRVVKDSFDQGGGATPCGAHF